MSRGNATTIACCYNYCLLLQQILPAAATAGVMTWSLPYLVWVWCKKE